MITKLNRLGATLGAFGGICVIVFLTGSAANAAISLKAFWVGVFITCAIEVVCIKYIDKYFDGHRWTNGTNKKSLKEQQLQ